MKIAHIVIDIPLHQHFDYLAQDISAQDIGHRVLVPWGRRLLSGIIIGVAEEASSPDIKLKAVREILRDEPALSNEILDLAAFCSQYYHFPLGQVLAGVLPQRLRRATALAATPALAYRVTAAGAAVNPEDFPARAIRKRQLLALMQGRANLTRREVLAAIPTAATLLSAFLKSNWIETTAPRNGVADGAGLPPAGTSLPPTDPAPQSATPVLNAEQRNAAQALAANTGFQASLLYGVTGSGKTEVYLQAMAAVLARGAQVLVLVPEINLTPQLEARFAARFPEVALISLHSHLNEGARLQNWQAAASGKAKIVLGTRLAVFTPMPHLELIIVDEEHDASYKQQEGMRYSARDVAVFRAKRRDIPIVLGSATPALETYHNALQGRYGLVVLRQRAAADATVPSLRCLDTRREAMTEGLSATLITALKQRLSRGEQSLLFINRRGYAPVLFCTACAWVSACHRCSSHLVVHLKQKRLHCHHCGYSAGMPRHCPHCGSADLSPLGQGTQRIEASLRSFFPKARILRVDRDSTRPKHALAGMLQQVRELEVDILVGTQMLAKGHDFPNLTLVGVINADGGLYSADFRASEKLFAQLLQVAGRAGRAALKGEVFIQTAFPEHPLFAALAKGDYASYAQALLQERAQAHLPPYAFQALIRAEAPELARALSFLQHAVELAPATNGVTLYDAVPALMQKVAGKERAQLLLEASSRAHLQKFLSLWLPLLYAKKSHAVRWSVDVDPQDI